jgi:hypothetical protein
MKNRILESFVFTVILLTISSVAFAQKGPPSIISRSSTGKEITTLVLDANLSDWTFFLKDKSLDPLKVFTKQDCVIHITGPFGYMRTKKEYSDFKLHVEWRWPSEATNSGVFLFAQMPDTIWPKCVECQLQAGNAGDFVCSNGSDMNERTDKTKRVVKKMTASNEKPVGEWNTMEITCEGNSIEVYVNGLLQNKASGVNLSKGSICLQSEGKDIEFRNVLLTKLKK